MAEEGFHLSWRWVALVLRGVIAIASGIAALEIASAAAKELLAAYFFADGILTLVLATRLHVPRRSRVLIGADAVVDIVVGVLLLTWAPGVPVLILIVALWAIATGVLEFVAAVLIPRFPAVSWAIALVGAASCAVGISMLDWTNVAELGLLYFFAAYSFIAGALFVAFGIVLARALHRAR